MDFRIADTFTASLARLTAQEQKAAKTTAFDLQMNPSAPGLAFHRLDRAKDANFWSVRASADIRLIIHRTASTILLAYVNHHDAAYQWAERRRIERHPTTGAMQLVEVRERVEEAAAFAAKAVGTTALQVKPKLFDNLRKFELMSFGVPAEWIEDVRAADEDTLFAVIDHLPQEAQEALLRLAVGERPDPAAWQPRADAQAPLQDATFGVELAPSEADAFNHPDAQRRFRVVENAEELRRALEFPWEKWAVFLHPAQRESVEHVYGGPAKVSGSAGTGKTIVALHRAVHLARGNPGARVLLTTFSKALAGALKVKTRLLVDGEADVAGRITVKALSEVGYDLYCAKFGQPNLTSNPLIRNLLAKASEDAGEPRFPAHFLFDEWDNVVDAWGLKTWEDYRDVSRLGRKTRIGGRQRERLWSIFEQMRDALAARKAVTLADVFGRLTDDLAAGGAAPFDFVVVDEAQDISVSEARFLAALGSDRPQCLFFAGDLGQRIFQQPFSWKSLGLDVRGRSSTLWINYRTSHQIRARADRLLPGSVSDVDGVSESRRGTISVFDGAAPTVATFADPAAEEAAVGRWIADRLAGGCQPHEIGVFVRSEAELKRARAAVKAAGALSAEIDDTAEAARGKVAVGVMHLAKGLEFRAVAVMACDDGVLPSQERIETVADDADLEDVYETERHLLYVACTRARDHLLVTRVAPGSEFLADFGG